MADATPPSVTTESKGSPRRIVVFGATGQLGAELLEVLDDSDWPIAEVIGVASSESAGSSFDFRGEDLDVAGEWPTLKGRDLVFICTRGTDALEIIRECLRAEVPCIDLTGALSAQREVPMPVLLGRGRVSATEEGIETAPLLGLPSPTALAWASLIDAIGGAEVVSRVLGTVLSSASSLGRNGVVSLSEESIALFNQAESPEPGPAGQGVAFDAIPGAGVDGDRVRLELSRLFGEGLGVSVVSLMVPAFVGEGASIAVELSGPVDRARLEEQLAAEEGVRIFGEGLGSRGLVAVEEDVFVPAGPTLRDAAGAVEVLVGRIEADLSLPEGRGWRFWLASDPVRLAATHAVRVAERRLGMA